ncbi:hypothetical protein [Stenotrophomonas sp. PA-6-5C]|uniref:recombination directionality factor n=1 Tax=Stenotrophomonas sp. PA-6-5C TaxID=2665487 RepID=UPI001F1F27FB|nr:hypothetical protein [Stenotrophomonas sp. PA-6-5C]
MIMLKGLAITPPVIGRISIGRVVERNGKRLPEKDDQFTLTSQVQNREGWILHPLDETLRKESGGKLRSIPVCLLFNDPGLNLRADYSLFDRTTGRPVCVGNGETSRRMMESSDLQIASSLGTTVSDRRMAVAGKPVEDAIACSSGTRSSRCESRWRTPSISILRSTGMLRGSITGRSRSRALIEGLNAISDRRGFEECHRRRRLNTFRYVEMARAIRPDLPWGLRWVGGSVP